MLGSSHFSGHEVRFPAWILSESRATLPLASAAVRNPRSGRVGGDPLKTSLPGGYLQ